MSTKRISVADRDAALERLHGWLAPGDTVYCVLRRVSRSGMSRVISLVVPFKGAAGTMLHPNHAASVVTGYRLVTADGSDGLHVSGCGMDMGFAVVYGLGRRMFPDGFGVEGKMPLGHTVRPKSRAAAAKAVERGAVFRGRNGDSSGWDNDGGYALQHQWL